MINYRKKIKGLCFVEDVYDDKNNKKSCLIFNNSCELIPLPNKYIKFFRETKSSSYCSISRIARDLCCLYDFLLFSNKHIMSVDLDILKEFVEFLKIIKVRRFKGIDKYVGVNRDKDFIKNKFSIERTLWDSLQRVNKGKINNSNITQLRETCGLDSNSIYRIFERVILYLKDLHKNKNYFNDDIIDYFKNKKDIRNFLKAQGIEIRKHEIKPVEPEVIFSEDEILVINEKCSTPYERLLYFVLERTGIRIGEALGIKILNYDRKNLRDIEGDFKYEDGRWTISICWRAENPFFCRTKSHCSRAITLKKSETQIFELLLERYLRWRISRVKKASTQWLFISNRGKHLTQNVAYSKFKATLNKAGLQERSTILTLHSYRHTFASFELVKGVPLEIISKILGHKNFETTKKTYIHFTKENITKMREDFDRKLEEDLNDIKQ